MLYSEVEEMIKTDDGILSLIDRLTPTFETIEDFSSKLRIYDPSGETVHEIMQHSNALWDELHIVFSAIDTYKTNLEKLHFYEQKINIEKSGGKFNASATEGEASALTANLRRIRNMVDSYRAACDKNISTAQSHLKFLQESKLRTQG